MMQVKTTKLASFMAALIILVSSLWSCAAGEQPVDTATDLPTAAPEASTEDPAYTPNLPERDFGGMAFNILVNKDPCFRHIYDVNAEGETGDLIYDTVYRRNKLIEERFNVTIKDTVDDKAHTTIQKTVLAGDATYSACWTKVDNFFSASLTGAFKNLHNTQYLDLTKKYWDQNAISDMDMGGKLYGLTGDITTAANAFTHLLIYNKGLGLDHGFEDLYQVVREGRWTFDYFNKLIKAGISKDLDGDGKFTKADFYALEMTPAAYESFFLASGEYWVTKDSYGAIQFAELTEKKVNILGKIVDMLSNTPAAYNGYDKLLENGRAIFYEADIGLFTDLRESEYDLGVLPVPKLDESQDRYYVYAYPFFPFVSIPSNIEGAQLDMASAVLEMMAAESYKTLTPAFYEVSLSAKYTRDKDSMEMLDLIVRNRVYDILYYYPWGNFRTELNTSAIKGSLDITSLYEKRRDKIAMDIEKVAQTFAGLE